MVLFYSIVKFLSKKQPQGGKMDLGSEKQLVRELIKKVKASSGDESQRAFEALLDRYEPLIKALLKYGAQYKMPRTMPRDIEKFNAKIDKFFTQHAKRVREVLE